MSTQLSHEEVLAIVEAYDAGKTAKELAYTFGRGLATIKRLISKYHPTTALAERYIKANAMTLATRVVRHASVEEAVDVLSRPNVGVLQPNKTGGGLGIFLSVNADSCGGVKQVTEVIDHGIPEQRQLSIQDGRPGADQDRAGEQSHEDDPDGGGLRKGRRGAQPDDLHDEAEVQAGGTGTQVVRTRARKKKDKAAPVFVDPTPSRKALGAGRKNKDSAIHLRYDI